MNALVTLVLDAILSVNTAVVLVLGIAYCYSNSMEVATFVAAYGMVGGIAKQVRP